jgi:hypothetical protein
LSANEMRELDSALAPEKISGPRYNASNQALIDR